MFYELTEHNKQACKEIEKNKDLDWAKMGHPKKEFMQQMAQLIKGAPYFMKKIQMMKGK